MSREELNRRQKALNLFFTVKAPIGNNLYRVYKPLYKGYIRRAWKAIRNGIRKIFSVRVNLSGVITIITVIAAITTIVMGVRSCV